MKCLQLVDSQATFPVGNQTAVDLTLFGKVTQLKSYNLNSGKANVCHNSKGDGDMPYDVSSGLQQLAQAVVVRQPEGYNGVGSQMSFTRFSKRQTLSNTGCSRTSRPARSAGKRPSALGLLQRQSSGSTVARSGHRLAKRHGCSNSAAGFNIGAFCSQASRLQGPSWHSWPFPRPTQLRLPRRASDPCLKAVVSEHPSPGYEQLVDIRRFFLSSTRNKRKIQMCENRSIKCTVLHQ